MEDLMTVVKEANLHITHADLKKVFKTNDALIAHYKTFHERVKEHCKDLTFFINICIQDHDANFGLVVLHKPKPLASAELTKLKETCEQYIDFVDDDEKYHEDNDFETWITEAALKAIYGDKIYDYINARNKARNRRGN